jgi:hypothetical protein
MTDRRKGFRLQGVLFDLQLVEGDVPRRGDRDLVGRWCGGVEDFRHGLVEQAQVLRHRPTSHRSPGGRLLDRQGEVPEHLGQSVRVADVDVRAALAEQFDALPALEHCHLERPRHAGPVRVA